ncbi:MAG TPA: hypothetical protein VJQ54_05200 [Candidatus Sulfotelmatobacter sp.]|nr:hypothetical protein [Candidatus Sulfotelmatobacter sp.]
MKFATVSKSLVMTFALLLACSAFAASSKGSMTLLSPATLNGTNLKAGDYKLEWEGTGSDVQLKIMQGKNVVAQVPAKVVEMSAPAPSNAAILNNGDNGKRSLAGARFQGKKYAIQIGESSEEMQSGSSK